MENFENLDELIEILKKITFRLPEDTWDLKSDEYKVIDKLSGTEIIKIAYQQKLNIPKLLANADKIVNEHNERYQKQRILGLKSLKRELLSEYRAAHDGHAEIDFQDDIERRFLAEAIDEVVRLDRTLGNADIEPEIEVNENHQTGATSDAAIPSMSHIPFPQNEFSAGSPSLQRNHAPSKITLSPEFIPVNLEAIAPTEDFGEATLEQMADAGVFGLPNAREMFNRLKRAETFQPGSPKFADPQMPEAAISLPHPEPPCPATPVQTTLAVEDPRLNRSTIGQVEPTGNDQPLVDDAIIPGPSRIAESEHVQAVAQNQDAAKVPDAVPVEDPQPGSSNAGADPRTAGRKARRRRPKKNVPETGFMKKLRALKKKARQPRVENFRAPIVRLRRPNEVYLDFADLADFVADEENLEDDPAEIEDVAVPEPQAVVLRAAGKENIPQNETSINVDDQAQISKRPRLAENYSIPPFGMSSLLPFTPSVTVNTMTLPQVATPAATGFKPSFVSTAHKITPEDYEFERLRNLSQKSLQPNASHEAHNHGSIQNLGLSDIAIPHPGSAVHFAEAPQLESVPKTPVYLRDFMTPAGKVIEFVGADGKLDRHSEFYMESVCLYFQIRLAMKKCGLWKLPLDDLLSMKIGLLKSNSRQMIENRLILLADQGFVKVTFMENQKESIDEVEIPIKTK